MVIKSGEELFDYWTCPMVVHLISYLAGIYIVSRLSMIFEVLPDHAQYHVC